MTRKEELAARARDYVSLFVMSGAEPAATKNLTWMLEQVEREVWGKVAEHCHAMHNDGYYRKVGKRPTTGARMMTRDEFVTRCDDLSSETKYSGKPWHIWLAEIAAHDAEQRAEIARLREALEVALTNLRAWNGEQTWELYRKSP